MEITQDGEFWRWEAAGEPLAVEFELGLVDRLSGEAIRGLGAVPRRGVEVGGVLLGAVRPGLPPTVVIRGYETIGIEYRFGPSFQLSEKDDQNLRVAMGRLQFNSPDLRPVGYFRSHTGEPMLLSAEDLRLLSEFFSAGGEVVLLIRPAVLKASMATFVVRRNGSFEGVPIPQEFPFRRRDLTGSVPERTEPEWHHLPRAHQAITTPETESETTSEAASEPDRTEPDPDSDLSGYGEPQTRTWRNRIAPAALLLATLALGAALGNWYNASRTASTAAAAAAEDPYSLRLRAVQQGDGVLVRWSAASRAIKSAEQGVLTISEGTVSKSVKLDSAQLRNGSVLYRHVAPEIQFRLDVFTDADRQVSETLRWKPKQ